MSEELRRLQLAELDILKETLKLAEAHQLTYYMLGGTLLGAVRHQGFIPWDDDIDIGMPRPDYERFLQAAERELKPPYQLHTLQTGTGEYSYYYARVENRELKLRRTVAIKESEIPVWIDVFPLDGVPEEGEKRERWIKKCKFWDAMYKASQFSYLGISESIKKKRSLPKRAARQLFLHLKLEKLISTRQAWEGLDRALKENKFEESDTLINFCGYWGLKEMFPKTVYGKGKLYPFEGMMLNGPEDFDTVLKQMYGDYMTPPQPEQRAHHYIKLLSQ